MTVASVSLTACQGDTIAAPYVECEGQPGCQDAAATVAPEVVLALDDANTRALSVLQPAERGSIATQLASLRTALVQRNFNAGRTAFAAVVTALDQAERANSESAPDLGVIRLGLVPTARSLGLPASSIEALTR